MLNESLFLLSFDELKNLLVHELTIFHVAIVYVLMYVVYKALGRYIYFKPQEHASKVNRTFLTIFLLIVLLHSLVGVTNYLPFLPEYRWLFMLSTVVILIAPLSIIINRVVWKYDRYGQKRRRDWHSLYLPITTDYYKTTVSKSEAISSSITNNWEEEGVETTDENVHSDVLLNILALVVFVCVSGKWTYDSAGSYGWQSCGFSVVSCITIIAIFSDQAIFSWIYYLETKIRSLFKLE